VRKQTSSNITLMGIITTITLFWLVSESSISLLTFNDNFNNNGANNAFAQQDNFNLTNQNNASASFSNVPQQGQGQTIILQNSTISSNNQTQQIQESLIKPFTIPKDNQDENIGSTNAYINSLSNSNESHTRAEIALLSQQYNSEGSGDKIVGEAINNGSASAQSVKVSASFYNQNGSIIGSASSPTDPSTIEPGNKAAFNIPISSDTIESDTENYELILQWKDTQHTVRVIGEQAEGGEDSDSGSEDSDSGSEDSDSGSEDSDSGSEDSNNN